MEVIQEQLAVVSLNTMYFYDSNKGACVYPRSWFEAQSHLTCGLRSIQTTYDASVERVAMATTAAVGGCEQGDPDDPGNLQFDWLEVQLARFRSRGMQVRVSGARGA